MKRKEQKTSPYTVGLNSSLKLIKAGEAEKVFLAHDCSPYIKDGVLAAAEQFSVTVDETMSMAELGKFCNIDVGCAVCAVRKK